MKNLPYSSANLVAAVVAPKSTVLRMARKSLRSISGVQVTMVLKMTLVAVESVSRDDKGSLMEERVQYGRT